MTTHSRRTFLSSCAALGAAPLVRQLRFGKRPNAPMRFVFVIKGSGIDRPNLAPGDGYPDSRTELLDAALDELPDVLSPLAPFRERTTIVQGLSGANYKGNHTAGYGTLSCHNSELTPIAPTVDALLGMQCSTGPYPMFGMATNGTLRGQQSVPDDAYVQPNLSALKAGQGVPFQASPTKAFQELFGRTTKSAAELEKEKALQQNLMAFLERDASRIKDRLHEGDAQRFEGYVETFGSLRRREELKAALADRIETYAPSYDPERYASMQHMDRMACQFEMAAAALKAGLTNVVTLRSDTLGTMYAPLGFGDLGVHAIGHGATTADGITSKQMRKRIDQWHAELIAKLAQQLAAEPEGDGTMLDNTVIVWTSCAGGSHHGGSRDWPFVLVGDLGGRLRTGRTLQFPSYGKDGHKGIASLYMSLMDAAGVGYGEHFGQKDPGLREIDIAGALPQLKA